MHNITKYKHLYACIFLCIKYGIYSNVPKSSKKNYISKTNNYVNVKSTVF